MKRKLVKQGDNALTVTLPAAWTQARSLTPGNSVDVREEGHELIISSAPTQETTQGRQQELIVNAGEEEKIRILYREGYELIHVRVPDAQMLSRVQQAVGRLYGFETVEITMDSCTIKSVHEEKPEELQSHVQRMKTMLGVLKQLVLKQFRQRKENEHIRQFSDNVIKQADLIVRLIRRHRLVEELGAYEQALRGEEAVRMWYRLYEERMRGPVPLKMLAFVEQMSR